MTGHAYIPSHLPKAHAPAERTVVDVMRGREKVDAYDVAGSPEVALEKVEAHIRALGKHMESWRGRFVLVAGTLRREVVVDE